MEGMAALERRSRLAFLSVTSSTELCFAAYGGFLFLNGRGEVLGVQGLAGEGHANQLIFGAPQTWRREFTEKLSSSGRFQPVTLPELPAGWRRVLLDQPGEEMVPGLKVDPAGMAFLYMMGDDHPHVSPGGRPSAALHPHETRSLPGTTRLQTPATATKGLDGVSTIEERAALSARSQSVSWATS